MAKRNVAADVVREWARENMDKISEAGHKCLGDKARGRLHPEVVTGFNRAHKNMRYAPGTPKESSLIKESVLVENKAGRKTPRTVTLTTAEVRDLTGHSGKGRIPKAVRAQAAQAKISLPA